MYDDHPEYEWNINGAKKLLKKIDKTGEVAWKGGSERPKSVRTEENTELVEEMILSQEGQPGTHSTLLHVNLTWSLISVPLIDQDLDLHSLKKGKAQIFTDSNTEKPMIHLRKVLSKYTHKTLQTAFFSDKKES